MPSHMFGNKISLAVFIVVVLPAAHIPSTFGGLHPDKSQHLIASTDNIKLLSADNFKLLSADNFKLLSAPVLHTLSTIGRQTLTTLWQKFAVTSRGSLSL